MKEQLLTIALFCTTLAAGASAPQLSWHKMIDSPRNAGDIMKCITVTNDGNVISLGNFGSLTDADNISFDGQVIATGAATNGTSENLNLLAIKHSAADGSRIWSISSKKGDFSSMGVLAMTGTPDGGVAMLIDMRSSNVTPFESPVIVDASGAEIDFPDWNTSCWMICQVLLKLSVDGNLQWVKPIIADQLPVPNASSGASVNVTTRSAFPYALAVDNDGNFYIGGNFRTPMIFTGAGNATYILQPRNLDSYNGDTQVSAGALYLVKLDSEGNYLTHLRASSADGITAEYINNIDIDGENIYFSGTICGKANSSLTIGKGTATVTLTKSSDQNGVMIGCLKASKGTDTLTPVYLTCVNSVPVSGSPQIQNRGFFFADGSLYLTGLFKGGIAANESEESSIQSAGTPLEGFCLRFDAATGKLEAGYANKISIGGYVNGGIFNGKLYLAGYRLNGQTGAFIDVLDPSTLELKSTTTIAKAGGAPTLSAAFVDVKNNRLYSLTRGNAAFTLTDDSQTGKESGYGWAIYFAAI